MKAKNGLRRFFASLLVVVLLLTGAPLAGVAELDFSGVADWFSTTAKAATEGYLEYEVENGEATITDCDESISGELVIPDTLGGYPVTSIDWTAFCDCTGLTSVTIPDGVTSVGGSAFYNCTGLTSVTIPDSVTSIGGSAFEDCIGLTSITIPDSVTSIGDDAFYDTAYYNNSDNWENGVLYIGNHLIEAKDSISGAYEIKAGTKTVAYSAFNGCTGLTSVTIPNSVTSIDEDAFWGCTGLTSITIPNSVTSIGGGAFCRCTGLTSVKIGSGVTSIESYAFSYCKNLGEINVADENSIYHSANNCVIKTATKELVVGCKSSIIPTDGSVTSIGDNAFDGCTGLTSITIPDSVTSIGDSAFWGCTGLTSITIPDGVTSIGASAFDGCTGLTNITIPDSVTSIGYYAFEGCTGLTNITIPDSVTSIGYRAFWGCIGLTSITIPDSVTSIGEDAFSYCENLGEINVADENSIYHSTNNCVIKTATKELVVGCKSSIIPTDGSVTSVGEYAFWGCTGLTSITIPDSVTSIGDYAFRGCTGLTNVVIPGSVTSIARGAFYACTGLTSITISDSVTSIGGSAFCDCTGLTSLTIPNSVTSIGYYALGYYYDYDSEVLEKIDNFTIYGYPNTAAETYATENGFTFVALDDEHTHSFSEWKVTKKATCETAGEKTRTCSACGTSETEEIPALGHTDRDGDGKCDRCGYFDPIEGECGDNAHYKFYPSGELVISGTGSIEAKIRNLSFADDISKVTIEDGITEIGNYAFDSCTSLTSITIPNSVTSIGYSAFYNCTGLTSITIPDSVTDIGFLAFDGTPWYNAQPDGELYLGKVYYAYRGEMPENTSVTIKDGTKAVAPMAFRDCSNLIEVTIPESVENVGDVAFYNCTNLKKVNWNAESVNDFETGYRVFYNAGTADSGIDVVFGDNVKHVPSHMFFCDWGRVEDEKNQPKVKSVKFGNSVESVGEYAFALCKDLESITLNSSISFDETSFIGCTGFKNVMFGSNVTNIGFEFLVSCTSTERLEVAEDNKVYHSINNCVIETQSKKLVIGCKNSVLPTDGSVTSIGEGAFVICSGLTSLEIPKSVTSIGEAAFYGCTGLTSITIPDSVTSIGYHAFGYYYDYDSDMYEKIDNFTIYGYPRTAAETYANENEFEFALACTHGEASYKEVPAVAETCTTDGYTAGVYCEECQVYISGHELIKAHHTDNNDDHICDICGAETLIATGSCGENATFKLYSNGDCVISGTGLVDMFEPDSELFDFENCYIKKVVIEGGITGLENGIFSGRDDLVKVVLPESMTSLGNWVFAYCNSLETVNLPSSIKAIGDSTFYMCCSLKKIAIPDGVETIGENAFGGDYSLETVRFGSGLKKIMYSAFHGCKSLDNIVLPEGLTDIGTTAFGECINISKITLPSTLERLGDGAFKNCKNLTELKIPKAVSEIGNKAVGYVYDSDEDDFIKDEDFKIYGYPNTAAETYATENGFTFISLDDEHTHSFSEWKVTKEATCTEEGEETRSCSCGETQTRKIEKIDHVMFTVVEPSTCKVKGVSYDVCDMCNETFNYTVLPLAPHTFSAWAVTKKATCETAGEKTRTCSVCGTSETEEISALEHSFKHVLKNATCKEEGFEKDVCENCGKEINAKVLPVTAHTFSAWTVTKEATVFESGERVRSCSVCGFEEKETIEKLKFEEVKDEKTDISVICPDGSYDGKVEIEVKETFDGESYHILNSERENYKKSLFDITTFVDGKKAQPNGSVWVKIPLPESYNPEKTTVYHVTNEGKLEKIESHVEGGYIIFETTHFSYYAIVDEGSQINPSSNCSCACHKKGIAKFFFKIKLFFQKIFKKNKICKCGVWHY